ATLKKSVEHFQSTRPSPGSDAPAGQDLSPMIPPNGKRLADFFGTEQLTESQTKAVDALQRFLEDPDERCFILRGYAGTGKTFLIGGLVRYLQEVHRKPLMMAPTGRAAHVLRDRHQVEASTVHRTIYSLAALKDYRELDEGGDITYKFYFDLKNNDIDHDTVFIVDEASMISDLYSESEFMHFGSGRLLSDLLRYINFDGNDYRKKLILVGDNAQLPPFGASAALPSPALDANYLLQKRRIKSSECELTDVVRQLDSSPILKNATEMRRMLHEDRFQKFDFVADGATIREFPLDEFIETFVREREAESFTTTVIVAYMNATTKTYNEAVRARLFPGIESLTAKDQIIVVRNNYNYERSLLNGQMGLVVATDDQLETRTVLLNVGLDDEGKRKIESIELKFRNATLRFSDDQGNPFDMTCKISEDCLLNGLSDLPSRYSKALYVDFQNRNPRLKPGQPEFKEALKADPYFNAVMLKFGYAITCHKAQGGEWRTVFVDFAGMNKLNAESMRWSYTALTRAESSVVATNALHHSILKATKQAAAAPVATAATLPASSGTTTEPEKESANPADVRPGLTLAAAIRQQVEQLLPEGWKIASTRTLPYLERVIFSIGSSQVTAAIYYKSNNRISKFQITPVQGQDAIDQQAADFLAPLKGLSLVHGQEATSDIRETHEPFIEELEGELAANQLELVSLKSNTEFHLVARFRHCLVEGSVNYYFKGKGMFSSFDPQSDCPASIIERIQSIHG
ncbi:MAG: ATP-dependent DNA helicase, partial [Verrucomicrobiaceae bacterium]